MEVETSVGGKDKVFFLGCFGFFFWGGGVYCSFLYCFVLNGVLLVSFWSLMLLMEGFNGFAFVLGVGIGLGYGFYGDFGR